MTQPLFYIEYPWSYFSTTADHTLQEVLLHHLRGQGAGLQRHVRGAGVQGTRVRPRRDLLGRGHAAGRPHQGRRQALQLHRHQHHLEPDPGRQGEGEHCSGNTWSQQLFVSRWVTPGNNWSQLATPDHTYQKLVTCRTSWSLLILPWESWPYLA